MIANLRKLLQGRMQKAIAFIFSFAIALAITALLPTTELSINDSCQVSGPLQKLRSTVQGQRYWTKQLQLLDEEVQYLEARPEKIKNVEKMVDEKTNEVLTKNRQFMEGVYSKYPQLRPSPQQTNADELRKQADAIEHAEVLEKLEQIYAKRIRALRLCQRWPHQSEQPDKWNPCPIGA